MTSIYLAHPYAEREYGIKIQKLLEDSGYSVCNPFDRPEQESYDQAVIDQRPFTYDECEELVEWDLKHIMDSDCVVVLVVGSGPFIGISMEISYATIHNGLDVFCLYLTDGIIHPWIKYLTTVVHTEEELLKAIE